LQGYRINPAEMGKVKAFILQNGNEYPAQTGGGSGVTNDEMNGLQSLEVILPETVTPGPAQIVTEADGLRSKPITIKIIPWTVPKITGASPTTGSPGTFIYLYCNDYHIYDEVQLTDAQGKVTSFEAGGSTDGTSFTIPKDSAEGVMTIRIGNKKYGRRKYSEPLTITVSNDPLPLELSVGWMTPVAPGQFLDLAVHSLAPVKTSELTQVMFTQNEKSTVVSAPNPKRARVAVPTDLSPGEVRLRVRTWRGGRASAWGKPELFRLAEKPVPPNVGGIRTEQGTWAHVWPGPDRPKSLKANPGDVIVFTGEFFAADVDRLQVTLEGGAGETISLEPFEEDKNGDWFGPLCIKLPDSMQTGEWRMTLHNLDDKTQVELPIVIEIG